MPELPEVETVMQGLKPLMLGQTIVRVQVNRSDLRWPLPPGLRQMMTGAHVVELARRAKYILVRLDRGITVLLHLGMSGRMTTARIADVLRIPQAHEHLVIETATGWRIGFVDPRRFGSVDMIETDHENEHPRLLGLGPEPLDRDFNPLRLTAALAGRHTTIKAALLDQSVVAGLGNIYVCEALFTASISPRRAAHTVSGERAVRLVASIKQTLTDAIAAGGSSLRDYVQPDGALGYFQHSWRVYAREGEPCPHCPGRPACPGVRRIVQAGRSTFYCPRTQR
jgi:formamidopyrimidine-DNA glycosylase